MKRADCGDALAVIIAVLGFWTADCSDRGTAGGAIDSESGSSGDSSSGSGNAASGNPVSGTTMQTGGSGAGVAGATGLPNNYDASSSVPPDRGSVEDASMSEEVTTMDARDVQAMQSDVDVSGDVGIPLEAGSSFASIFDCKFGWGEPTPGGSLASDGWLQFMTEWAGSSIKADGSVSSCETCGWLTQLASTNIIPTYYAYVIGFYGHASGLPDQNQSPSGANLATGAGALIFGAANTGCPSGKLCAANKIVQAYAYYAQQSHKAWPSKPLLWLLEGDYVQYAATSQTRPLTYSELGQLAALIVTTIKSNMPNALVGMNHSTWNSDAVTNSFWAAMAQADLDFIWADGVGNNNGYIAAGSNAQTYNGKTARYDYLRTLTGKRILVDESNGLSQESDTWSNQSAATLNARISEGVFGVNITGTPPPSYQSSVNSLRTQLGSTCP